MNKMKGMDHDVLLLNRRKSLKLWNQSIVRKITNSSQVSDDGGGSVPESIIQQELTALFETMISKFLPCFFRLASSSAEDKAMIDEIRQDWLSVIDSNLPGNKMIFNFQN